MRRGSSGLSVIKAVSYAERQGYYGAILTFLVDSTGSPDIAPIINWSGIYTANLVTDEGSVFACTKDTACPLTFATEGVHKVQLVGVPASAVKFVDARSPNIASTWVLADANPVIPTQNFPLTWFDGTTYHSYGANADYTAILHSTSADGITWVDDVVNNPVLSKSAGGTIDQTTVAVSLVWNEGASWFMLYRGNGLNTCLATGTDAVTWTKYVSNPVLAGQPDPAGIIKDGTMYYLYANSTVGNRFIRCWMSKDLIAWAQGPITPIMAGTRYCSAPFKFGGKFYLIVSKYWGSTNQGSALQIFRDDSPTFANAELLGYVHIRETNTGVDTPTVPTTDITRSAFPGNKLVCYMTLLTAGAISYPGYIFSHDDIQTAINASVSPLNYNSPIGNMSDGRTRHGWTNNRMWLQKFVARGGEVNYIRFVSYVATNAKVGVYSDVDNLPAVLLGSSAGTACVAGENWVPLSSGVTLSKGTSYWLAVDCSVYGSVVYETDYGQVCYVDAAYANAFPANMPAVSRLTADISISGWYAPRKEEKYLM